MVTMAVLAVGLIFVMAGVVGVIDAVRAPRWRRVAAERRASWEARGVRGSGTSESAAGLAMARFGEQGFAEQGFAEQGFAMSGAAVSGAAGSGFAAPVA